MNKLITAALMAATVFAGGCFGFCGAGPGQAEASLYITDAATGRPVRQPTFAEAATTLTATCEEPDAHDAGMCGYWLLVGEPANQTVTVKAAGYRPATVTVNTLATLSAHVAIEMVAE